MNTPFFVAGYSIPKTLKIIVSEIQPKGRCCGFERLGMLSWGQSGIIGYLE
jgi:hypothetical protein